MDGWMDGLLGGWMDGKMAGRMDRLMGWWLHMPIKVLAVDSAWCVFVASNSTTGEAKLDAPQLSTCELRMQLALPRML